MPREPRATIDTLTDQLETQTAADERHETTPFDEFASPASSNGHVPEGVRPSERCGTPSGLGIGCTFKDEHAGRHSWQPETAAADVAELIADPQETHPDQRASGAGPAPAESSNGQPTLPGTPEPETNEYTVPTEGAFKNATLMAAPGLQAIAERLIGADSNLEHLLDTDIRYAWRRRGGTEGGAPRYARIKRPSAWERFFSRGGPEFLVDLSADHIRDAKFELWQIEAAIHECLSRTEADPDDHDAYRIVGYDFKGTTGTLDKFGAWKPELREMRAHVARLPLEQAIDEAADSDADEGEESE